MLKIAKDHFLMFVSSPSIKLNEIPQMSSSFSGDKTPPPPFCFRTTKLNSLDPISSIKFRVVALHIYYISPFISAIQELFKTTIHLPVQINFEFALKVQLNSYFAFVTTYSISSLVKSRPNAFKSKT